MHITNLLIAVTLACALSACGDPEKSAQSAVHDADKAWKAEAADMNPTQRLKRYDRIIQNVKSVGEDYPETRYGSAIAAGREIDGVSLPDLQRRRNGFAPRAACYAQPTVACLRPFSSQPRGDSGFGNGSPNEAFAEALQLVCTRGFTAADGTLDAIKINRQIYAQELLRIALAAAECKRPGEVKEAITRYMVADPAQADEHANALLRVLADDALEPAWPMVMVALEKALASEGITGDVAASAMISLAIKYAQMGNTKAALAKYAALTDVLHYQADRDSKRELAAALILGGNVEDGLTVADVRDDQDLIAIVLHEAAGELGARMALTTNQGFPVFTPGKVANIQDYIVPVDAARQARTALAAGALEAAIDKFAPAATRSNLTLGLSGFDSDYGILALAYQALGEPAKALAAMKKGVDFRARLLGSEANVFRTNSHVSDSTEYSNFAKYGALLAIAQNRLADAAMYVKKGDLSLNEYARLLMIQVARTQDAAPALAFANTIGGQRKLSDCYSDMIPEMARAGKAVEIQKLMDAWPGDSVQKNGFFWPVVQGMIEAGDADGARKYANAHHLADDAQGKLRLDGQMIQSKKIAVDKAKAEPILREMFDLGQDIDATGGIRRGNIYSTSRDSDATIAQNAAREAFRNGYVDMGIELYEKATNKDQRPLVVAFTPDISKEDMTRVLMLAQGNVDGENLQYVIDAAIRQLQALPGSAS